MMESYDHHTLTTSHAVRTAAVGEGYPLVLVALCAALLGGYALYLWLLPKPLPGIPYNAASAKSILGDLPQMLKEVLVTKQFFNWCARQNQRLDSPIVQVFVQPFSKPFVLISDPVEAKDSLAKRKQLDRSHLANVSLVPFGAFHAYLPTGDRFKKARQEITDVVTPSFLISHGGPATYAAVVDFLKLVELKARLADGRPFDFRRDLNHASREVMVEVWFGDRREISSVRPQIAMLSEMTQPISQSGDIDKPVDFPQAPLPGYLAASRHIIDLSDMNTISLSKMPYLLSLWLRPKTRRDYECVAKTLRSEVDKSLARLDSGEKKCATDVIMSRIRTIAEKEGRQPLYKNQETLDNIFSLYCSGEHTTSTVTAWIVKFLTENQDAQKKLRVALYNAYPEALAEKRLPTNAELTRTQELVPYLEAVIEEGLRLQSGAIPRDVIEDTEILGARIPKGTTVFFLGAGPGYQSPSVPVGKSKRSATTASSVQRGWDESRDMTRFEPERWLVQNEKGQTVFDANAGPLLAFGGGPRGCFGKRMGYISLRYTIALLVWNFDFLEIPSALGGRDAITAVTHEAEHSYVRLQRRTETGVLS